MEKLLSYLPIISLCVGAWALINGILHDTFVLMEGRKYDRDLLRLLLDGHILITCGLIQILTYKGIKSNEAWAVYISMVATLSLLTYCGMIWPFLKSIATIVLNLSLLFGVLVWVLQKQMQ